MLMQPENNRHDFFSKPYDTILLIAGLINRLDAFAFNIVLSYKL